MEESNKVVEWYKAYLETLLQLETFCAAQEGIVGKLQERITDAKDDIHRLQSLKANPPEKPDPMGKVIPATLISCLLGALLGALIGLLGGVVVRVIAGTFVSARWAPFLGWGALIGYVLLFFFTFIVNVRDGRKKLTEYPGLLEKHAREVENSKEEIARQNREIHAVLLPRVQKTQKLLEETRDLLQRCYALGYLDEQYRKMKPVCKFLEYFENGDCTELEGEGGAYALYEQAIQDEKFTNDEDWESVYWERAEVELPILVEAIEEKNQLLRELEDSSALSGEGGLEAPLVEFLKNASEVNKSCQEALEEMESR